MSWPLPVELFLVETLMRQSIDVTVKDRPLKLSGVQYMLFNTIMSNGSWVASTHNQTGKGYLACALACASAYTNPCSIVQVTCESERLRIITLERIQDILDLWCVGYTKDDACIRLSNGSTIQSDYRAEPNLLIFLECSYEIVSDTCEKYTSTKAVAIKRGHFGCKPLKID